MSFFWPKRPSSSRADPAERTSGFGARRLVRFVTRQPRRVLATRIRAFTATAFVVLAASLLATVPAQAAPGDLDPTFSGDGKELTSIRVSAYGNAVAIQSDGRIVAVGGSYAGAGGTHDFALARYMPDGSLDTSFDGDGKLTTDLGGGVAYSVALQPDGKIVAAGGGAAGFALARYLPNGSLDASFDGDGKLTTDLGVSYGVVLQPDGKIVAAGRGAGGFALARYNADGSLDTSFDGDGKRTTDFGGGWACGVALQSDGKIVAVGSAPGFGGEGDFALARYNANGSIDTSFSGDGTQTTDLGGDEGASDIGIQPDGKIVAVGSSYSFIGSSTTAVVARYSSAGSLDPGFGTLFAGLQLTSVSGTDAAGGVALQPDGKIVAVGATIDDLLLARYNANGSPDAAFSDDGTQTTDFGGGDGAGGIALQPDGKIVAAGTTYTYGVDGSAVGSFALARYQGGSVAGSAPTNSSPPTMSGTATEGQTLTINPGDWTGSAPINHTNQWRRCDSTGANCVDIAGATVTTYALAAADVGRTIRVRETATNPYGQNSVASAPSAVVTAKPKPGAIVGTVRNAKTGALLASATVNCGNGYSAKTTSKGAYSILNVAPATYNCTASANGYQPSSQDVTVHAGQTPTASFSLVRR
jgi:uncharacterized delta-60 repeat protein